jgi:ATP-dependent Clp protease protease subunit
MLRIRDRLYQIYADATGQTVEKITNDCDRNHWLDDKEMVAYGLVDKVLTSMPRIVREGSHKDE